MPDISLCMDRDCPSSKYCHRFTAKPNVPRQAYTSFHREEDAMNCDSFWPNGVDSQKCTRDGVKLIGQTCSKKDCTYPNCLKD